MKTRGRLLGILCGGLMLAAVVWAGRYSRWAVLREQRARADDERAWQEQKKSLQLAADDLKERERRQRFQEEAYLERLGYRRPKIAAGPPFPNLKVDTVVFDLGLIPVDRLSGHKFKIRNVGQAALILVMGPPPCKTTPSPIPRRQEVAPGGSLEIELSCSPREPMPAFAKTIYFWTNDPHRSVIEFKIFGRVEQQIKIEPERAWDAGHVTDDRDGIATGLVASFVDPDFKITSVAMPDKHVKVQYRPLSAFEGMHNRLKAGYEFTVTVGREIPPGPFRRELQIHTTLKGNDTIRVDVTAFRRGPILFLSPIGNSRAYWLLEKSRINLGRFAHERGVKVELPALVWGSKEKFAITSVDSDADFVKVRVVPDPAKSHGEQQGIRFVFEVPAGALPVTRVAPYTVHLNLKTNHPKLREMSFQVEFVSQ